MHSNAGEAARRYPVGAELLGPTAWFRVWAPERRSVTLILDEEAIALRRESDGHFSCVVEGLRPGVRYSYRLDDEAGLEADPASRWQPEGPGAFRPC